MNDNMKKGNTVLLTIIAVATLLVAVVGATFAYFTATVSGTASSVIVTTEKLATLTYTSEGEVKLENALPGAQTSEYKFTVKATGESKTPIKYSLKWSDVTNEFASNNGTNDLVYTLTGSNGSGKGEAVTHEGYTAPTASGAYIGSGTIYPEETHTYTLILKFKENGSDQNSLQGKSFYGKIEVTTTDESGSALYYNNSNPSGTSSMPSSEE